MDPRQAASNHSGSKLVLEGMGLKHFLESYLPHTGYKKPLGEFDSAAQDPYRTRRYHSDRNMRFWQEWRVTIDKALQGRNDRSISAGVAEFETSPAGLRNLAACLPNTASVYYKMLLSNKVRESQASGATPIIVPAVLSWYS